MADHEPCSDTCCPACCYDLSRCGDEDVDEIEDLDALIDLVHTPNLDLLFRVVSETGHVFEISADELALVLPARTSTEVN